MHLGQEACLFAPAVASSQAQPCSEDRPLAVEFNACIAKEFSAAGFHSGQIIVVTIGNESVTTDRDGRVFMNTTLREHALHDLLPRVHRPFFQVMQKRGE